MRTRSGDKEKAILDAATRQFAIGGYHGTKMTQIAEEAGVGAGSVYLYFKNKQQILDAIFDRLWESLSGTLSTMVDDPYLTPERKLEWMIDLVFDVFTDNAALAIVFVNEHSQVRPSDETDMNPHFTNFIATAQAIVESGKQSGRFSAEVDAAVYCHFVFGGLRRIIYAWARSPDAFPLERVRQQVKRFTQYGIMDGGRSCARETESLRKGEGK